MGGTCVKNGLRRNNDTSDHSGEWLKEERTSKRRTALEHPDGKRGINKARSSWFIKVEFSNI